MERLASQHAAPTAVINSHYDIPKSNALELDVSSAFVYNWTETTLNLTVSSVTTRRQLINLNPLLIKMKKR